MFKSVRRILGGDQGPYTFLELCEAEFHLDILNFFTLGKNPKIKEALQRTKNLLDLATSFMGG